LVRTFSPKEQKFELRMILSSILKTEKTIAFLMIMKELKSKAAHFINNRPLDING